MTTSDTTSNRDEIFDQAERDPQLKQFLESKGITRSGESARDGFDESGGLTVRELRRRLGLKPGGKPLNERQQQGLRRQQAMEALQRQGLATLEGDIDVEAVVRARAENIARDAGVPEARLRQARRVVEENPRSDAVAVVLSQSADPRDNLLDRPGLGGDTLIAGGPDALDEVVGDPDRITESLVGDGPGTSERGSGDALDDVVGDPDELVGGMVDSSMSVESGTLADERSFTSRDDRRESALGELVDAGLAEIDTVNDQILVDIPGAVEAGQRQLLRDVGFSDAEIDQDVRDSEGREERLDFLALDESAQLSGDDLTASLVDSSMSVDADTVADMPADNELAQRERVERPEFPIAQPVSGELIRELNQSEANLERVSGANDPISLRLMAARADGVEDLVTEVRAGRMTNEQALAAVPAVKEAATAAEVRRIVEDSKQLGLGLVPVVGTGMAARELRGNWSDLSPGERGLAVGLLAASAVADVFVAGTVARGGVRALSATGRATLAGKRVAPGANVVRVTTESASPQEVLRAAQGASNQGQDFGLVVRASDAGDAAHIARAQQMRETMQRSRVPSRQVEGEAVGSTRVPVQQRSVEIQMSPDGSRVMGGIQLEESLVSPATASDGLRISPLRVRRVIQVEDRLSETQLQGVVRAAQETGTDSFVVRSVVTRDNGAAHVGGDLLAKRLRQAGVKVTRERLTARPTSPGEGATIARDATLVPERDFNLPSGLRELPEGGTLVQLPGRRSVEILPAGPELPALPPGRGVTLEDLFSGRANLPDSPAGGGGRVRLLVTRDGRLVPEAEAATLTQTLTLPPLAPEVAIERPLPTRTATESPPATRRATETATPARRATETPSETQTERVTVRETTPATRTTRTTRVAPVPTVAPENDDLADAVSSQGVLADDRAELEEILTGVPVPRQSPVTRPQPVTRTSPAVSPRTQQQSVSRPSVETGVQSGIQTQPVTTARPAPTSQPATRPQTQAQSQAQPRAGTSTQTQAVSQTRTQASPAGAAAGGTGLGSGEGSRRVRRRIPPFRPDGEDEERGMRQRFLDSVEWIQGVAKITVDMDSGQQTFSRSATPKATPEDTFRPLGFDNDPPETRTIRQGIMDVTVGPDGLTYRQNEKARNRRPRSRGLGRRRL